MFCEFYLLGNLFLRALCMPAPPWMGCSLGPLHTATLGSPSPHTGDFLLLPSALHPCSPWTAAFPSSVRVSLQGASRYRVYGGKVI